MEVDPRQLEKWALEADIRALLGLDRDNSEYGAQVGEVANLSRWYRGFGFLGVGALTHLQQSGPPAREAQCYLILLLGSTLFVDKSKDRVSAVVNLFVKRPDMLGEYAWGARALAYLYRQLQLGVATRAGSKGLCGCLTLLQAWIYEYFPLFRPSQLPQSPDAPRASSWISPRLPGGDDARHRLALYRLLLDELSADDVTWTPYGRDGYTYITGIIHFSDIVEGYDPARCLR
ncbi:unnamed protein product [Linum tenue]|uniref:Aminotransferase-like plant mobile domain-containing protein n=1 Tax=Linum tenue TaxID=586396 RepID=A0AAV0MK98_9ROSI|nr:unnamed protein product [Linum tenue]